MKKDQLLLIIKAAEFINSNMQLEEVLSNVVEVASNLTNADRGTLYLVDKNKGELRSFITMGTELKEITLKIGEGIAGYVAQSGKTLNVADVQNDSKFNPKYDNISGYTTNNMLCFPIKNRNDETVGVLQMLNSKQKNFSSLDEDYLKALSIHTAIAINNALMHKAQIEAKEEVQKINKKLMAANETLEKFAMYKSHFIAQMSHEIKTPLNIMMGSIQLLNILTAPKDGDEIKEVFDALDSGSNRLLRTVNEIIEYSRLNSGEYEVRKESLNLEKEIITPIINNFREYVERKGIELIYENNTNRNKVVSDRFMTHQIIWEIIDNAIKFTSKGKVEVKQFINKKNELTVTIKDTGEGMSPEYITNIFEPFSQEHIGYTRKYEGNGLALALVKKYADLNRINIEVKSEKNIGSEFTITFC